MRPSSVQPEASPATRYLNAKRGTTTYPSWWRALHPRGTARFWRSVDMERKLHRIGRSDVDGITFIVNRLKEFHHG